MRYLYLVLRISLCVLIVAASGCSNPGSENDDREPTVAGTWALTLLTVITPTGQTKTDVMADSSEIYLEVEGTNVSFYQYDGSDSPRLKAGRYDEYGGTFIFTDSIYTVMLDEGALVVRNAADSSRILSFSRYTKSIPPSHWPGSAVVGDDLFEPDDSLSLAGDLADGDNQLHTASRTNVDWFRIEAEAGKVYLINIQGPCCYDLNLYGADGIRIEPDRERISVSPFTGSVILDPAGDQVFYLKFNAFYYGLYTISMSVRMPVNSPVSGAWYISSSIEYSKITGDTTGGHVYSDSTMQYIRIWYPGYAEEHSYRDFSYRVDTTSCTFLSRSEVLMYGRVYSVELTASMIRTTFDPLDDEYVFVTTYLPYTGAIPPASWLTGPAVPENCTDLEINGSVQVYLEPGRDVWCRLSVNAGAYLVVYTEGIQVDPEMWLFAAENGYLKILGNDDDSNGSNPSLMVVSDQAGYYYILLRSERITSSGYCSVRVGTD